MLTLVAILTITGASCQHQLPQWASEYDKAIGAFKMQPEVLAYVSNSKDEKLSAAKNLRARFQPILRFIDNGNSLFYPAVVDQDDFTNPLVANIGLLASGASATAYAAFAEGDQVNAVMAVSSALRFLRNIGTISDESFVRSVSSQVSLLKDIEPQLMGLSTEASSLLAKEVQVLANDRFPIANTVSQLATFAREQADDWAELGWDPTQLVGRAPGCALERANSLTAAERSSLLPSVHRHIDRVAGDIVTHSKSPMTMWFPLPDLEESTIDRALASAFMSHVDLILRRQVEKVTRYHIVLTYCAIADFRWKYGRLPAILSEVDTAFSTEPVTGKPLAYVKEMFSCRVYGTGGSHFPVITLGAETP